MAKGQWVILNVDNVDKSLEFYKSLGLRAKRESMDGMTFGSLTTTTDSGILLWNKHTIAPGQAEDTRAWVSGDLGKGVMVSIGVPDARKAWDKAQAARVTVDQPLRDQEWGGREFTVVDPDGYVVNVTDRFPGAPTTTKRPAKARKAAKRAAPAKKAKGARKGR